MRISRFVFALMLLVTLALSGGPALVKAHCACACDGDVYGDVLA